LEAAVLEAAKVGCEERAMAAWAGVAARALGREVG
jgi:hypothetical protein